MARIVALKNEIEDDRGVRHALNDLPGSIRVRFRVSWTSFRFIESESERNPVLRAALLGRSELRDVMSARANAVMWFVLVCIMMTLCVVAIVLMIRDGRPGGAVLPGVCLLLFPCMPLWHARIRAKRRRELRTLPPVCIACAYDLTGVPAQPDGCTVCPECGAAWRLGDSRPGDAP